ncbi:AAA domain-containing protein [Leifsonia sp. EB34]|uniref:AAA domain-containing protein n=1 Tax=Leifsonia sp. EB34 TaxID=3156303 RepID=UPI00351886CC
MAEGSEQTLGAIIRRLREDPVHGADRFRSVEGAEDSPETVVAGLIYRFRELTADEKTDVTLTVYVGVGELGGALWRQETSALERLGGLAHSALPELLDSGYIPPDDVGFPGAAYVRTRQVGLLDLDAAASQLSEFLMQRPADAVRHLWLLADALAAIHDSRISHRNLWSGTVEFETPGLPEAEADDPEALAGVLRVQLARFEMSGMLSNLLRALRPGRAGPEAVREFLLRQPARSRVFAPPERLRFMFGHEDRPDGNEFSSDVFGLGMIAVDWLFGAEMFGTYADYGDTPSVLALQKRIRSAVAASRLPRELRELIAAMIAENPPRPTAADVVEKLGRIYGAALMEFEAGGEEQQQRPYLVAYMPGSERTDKTLFRWGYLSESTSTPDGEAELAELIKQDMRGSRVLKSASGAAPFVWDGLPERAQKAKTVIEGRRFVWFLEEMFKRHGIGLPKHYPQVQIIRYVIDKSRIYRSLETFLARNMSRVVNEVDTVNFELTKQAHDANVLGRPLWGALLDKLVPDAPSDDATLRRRQAMSWYVDYQAAVLRSREYAYEVIDASVPGRPRIASDQIAERTRISELVDSLTRVVVDNKDRPVLTDFIRGELYEQDKEIKVSLAEEGTRLRQGMTATVDSVRGNEIELKTAPGHSIPSHGWLRLADDNATSMQIRAQRAAVEELSQRRDLLAQLEHPSSSPRGLHRWGADAAGTLSGEGAQIVRQMLAHETLFVVQGPPGTGKTTITAQAVSEFLRRELGGRVLVSAQSHDALDNLAERILQNLELKSNGSNRVHTAVRVASQHTERSVSPGMSRYLEDAAVRDLVVSAKRAVRDWLTRRQGENRELVPILTEWLGTIDGLALDLRWRLRRGTNLVFATTGAATEANLVDRGSDEPFDWVIIEEAAHAWPSELAIALVRGTRWTLVGDHAQIGAYGRSDIERFLADLIEDQDPELQEMSRQRETLVAGFELFAELLRMRPDEPATWRHTLREQRRMDERIAEIVSTTFYKESGGLASPHGRRPHGLNEPEWVTNRAIVWVDTQTRKRATRRNSSWSNDDEAQDVARIVRKLDRGLREQDKSVVVLTPYRGQMEELKRRMAEHTQDIATIDSFQGREADVVVVSLVRDQIGDRDNPATNAGHLVDSGRANVLLSRARSLLVMVGNLELFEAHAGDEWAEIVSTIRRNGDVITLAEAGLV